MNNLLARPARAVAAAGSLSLASVLALSGVAMSASVPAFAYTLTGDTLRAVVTGDARTGVWRVRIVSPSGARRVDFVLRSGDVAWSGVVRVSRREGNSWSLVSRQRLDDALAGGSSVGACNAGTCWDSAHFRLPRDGDARFAVTVRLTHDGTYRVAGAVRQASEAFVYGDWLTSRSATVAH